MAAPQYRMLRFQSPYDALRFVDRLAECGRWFRLIIHEIEIDVLIGPEVPDFLIPSERVATILL